MLSIVIPTLNRPQLLVKLVESLQKQKTNFQFEIIVVYNSLQFAAQTPLHPTPHLQILTAPQKGVNAARNCGLKNARGSVILFIDDDCEAEDSYFLQKHYDQHQIHPKLPALGGPYELKPQAHFWDRVYQKNIEEWLNSNRVGEHETWALLGGNTSYKSSVFKNGLCFTDEISYGGSETPLNTLLALKFGPLGFFSDISVTHKTDLNFFSFCKKAYWQGRGAALQTKIYGHPLWQMTSLSQSLSRSLKWGLEVYAFIFMVSYKTHWQKKNIFWIFFLEIWSRYVLQQKERWQRRCNQWQQQCVGQIQSSLVRVYWWQYAHLRHPFVNSITRTYWWTKQKLWDITSLFWKIYPAFCACGGFIQSLFEPIAEAENKSFLHRSYLRTSWIAKKWGWLFLKTAGLR